MSFNNDFTRKHLDATESDAIRALRPGGPLDRVTLILKCTRCSQQVNETLRWFQLHDFVCTCGGPLDDKPLRDAIAQGTVNNLIRTRSPEEIMKLIQDRKPKQ